MLALAAIVVVAYTLWAINQIEKASRAQIAEAILRDRLDLAKRHHERALWEIAEHERREREGRAEDLYFGV